MRQIVLLFLLLILAPLFSQSAGQNKSALDSEQEKTAHEFIAHFNRGNDDIVNLFHHPDKEYVKFAQEVIRWRDEKIGKITLHEMWQSGDTIRCAVSAENATRLLFLFTGDKILAFQFSEDIPQKQRKAAREFIRRYNNGNDDIAELYYTPGGKPHTAGDYAKAGEEIRRLRNDDIGEISLHKMRQSGDSIICDIYARKVALLSLAFVEDKIAGFRFSGKKTFKETITPKEMKETADFFFSKVYELHPDPYHYVRIKNFEEKREQIYKTPCPNATLSLPLPGSTPVLTPTLLSTCNCLMKTVFSM